jgi:hypothetical protein
VVPPLSLAGGGNSSSNSSNTGMAERMMKIAMDTIVGSSRSSTGGTPAVAVFQDFNKGPQFSMQEKASVLMSPSVQPKNLDNVFSGRDKDAGAARSGRSGFGGA